MIRLIITFLIIISTVIAKAQTQNKIFYFYAGPVVSKTLYQLRESTSSGDVVREETKPWKPGLVLGSGFSISLKDNWTILAEANLQHKGSFRKEMFYISNGIQYKGLYDKHQMIFLTGILALEKQIELKKPRNTLAISAGGFYGTQLFDIQFFDAPRKTNDDIGLYLGVGWRNKNFFYKLVFEKGLEDVFTARDVNLTTNTFSFRFGYFIF